MSVIPLSPAEVPAHLPLAQAADGERHHALALRIADEIVARMFPAPVAPKERQFVLGVAQFMAGARRTMPSKPGAMNATRAREIRERAPHAAIELLDAARAADTEPPFAGEIDGLPAYPRPFTYRNGEARDANGVKVPAWLLSNREEDARCNTL